MTGCSKVSAGCDHCYAKRLALRLKKMGSKRYRNGFAVTLHEDALELPLRWREPRRIFANSMSDLFHGSVPTSFIDRVFDVMERASWHQFQVLTKRPGRMAAYVTGTVPTRTGELVRALRYVGRHVPDNVWLGTSVEDHRVVDRIVPGKRRTGVALFGQKTQHPTLISAGADIGTFERCLPLPRGTSLALRSQPPRYGVPARPKQRG